MKVQMINSNTKILPDTVIGNLRGLISRMESKNSYTAFNKNCSFSQTTLTHLSIKNSQKLMFFAPLKRIYINDDAKIVYNNRKYLINPNTGLVKNVSPFFKRVFEPFKTTVKNISNAISMFNKDFENANIVNQHKVVISGFTPKGAKIINDAQSKVFGKTL